VILWRPRRFWLCALRSFPQPLPTTGRFRAPVWDKLADRPRIDIAYGGSCTAGKREDFAQYSSVGHARQRLGAPMAEERFA